MKTAIFTIITIFVFISEAFSTVGPVWTTRYNGSGNSLDMSYAIVLDQAGNIYVTGYSTGASSSKDYKTIKYNPDGIVLWEATFDGPIHAGDYSYALTVDNAGNVYVTGRVDYGTTFTDIVTIKYNSLGVQQWFARYDGPVSSLEEGKSIQVDNSGNVYVGGRSVNSTNGYDFIIIKYTPSGTQSWVAIYNGPGNSDDYIASMALDNSGNVYVTGGSIGANTGMDYVTIKYNSSGAQQWVKRYNSPTNGGDAAVGVKVDSQGNIVTGGYTDMGPVERFNFLTIKYDANGIVLWEKQFNGTSSNLDLATAMTIDAADNIYLTGLTTNNAIPLVFDSNYVTIKYNSSGQLQWTALYNGPNNSVDVSRSIFVDNALNVYITGSSKGIGSDDFVSIKYLPNGTTSWVMTYNGPGNGDDNSSSVVADALGNAYVTGRSTGMGSDYDYATIKYGDLVGINPVSSQVPDRFSLYQNYPNPFNPSTIIKFDLPEESNVALRIFSILGAEVFSEDMGSLQPATYEYALNAANLPSGIYFYSLVTNRVTETKKMILVK